MTTVNVKIKAQEESSYPIIIKECILDNAYEYIKMYTKANKFLVVTNTTVYALYGDKLKSPQAEFIVLPDGEEYKNIENLNKIIDKALEIKLERKDAIIALGGGVIGDMAGFAASVYQRGVDFIQIPTTLLAQVDSSVGGKVAVNHKLGKNMIGAFYQPKLVLTDTITLNTLDDRQYKTGLSEVIKYSFIENSCNAFENYHLFDFLRTNIDNIKCRNQQCLITLIKICCELKSAVVNQDEKEKGLRAILNFGHTYAHAIENITEYKKYTHGEAVSIGMKLIFDLALRLNKVSKDYYNSSLGLLNDYNLITSLDFTPDAENFYNIMKSDKKVSDSAINFIIPLNGFAVEKDNNIDKNTVISGIK